MFKVLGSTLYIKFLSASFFVLFITACSSSKILTTWADSEYKGGPLNKIVVIGVFKNLANRKKFEENIARRISERSGTEAVSSLLFMPPKVKYEYKNMEKIFNENGIDGILIVRTKSIDNASVFVPPRSTMVTDVHNVRHPYYNDYYVYTWRRVREPGYVEEAYIVSTESSLFLNSDDKIIWTMENSTKEIYLAQDGITNPDKESAKIAIFIQNSLKSEKLLLP